MMKGVASPRVRPTRGGGFAALLDGEVGEPSSTKASATFESKKHAHAESNRVKNAYANQNCIAFLNRL